MPLLKKNKFSLKRKYIIQKQFDFTNKEVFEEAKHLFAVLDSMIYAKNINETYNIFKDYVKNQQTY